MLFDGTQKDIKPQADQNISYQNVTEDTNKNNHLLIKVAVSV